MLKPATKSRKDISFSLNSGCLGAFIFQREVLIWTARMLAQKYLLCFDTPPKAAHLLGFELNIAALPVNQSPNIQQTL